MLQPVRAPLALLTFLFLSYGATAASGLPQSHSIRIEGSQFVLDGEPFQIVSGEMHYARIPRADWRDRLSQATDVERAAKRHGTRDSELTK